jgi:hypothetical protein
MPWLVAVVCVAVVVVVAAAMQVRFYKSTVAPTIYG